MNKKYHKYYFYFFIAIVVLLFIGILYRQYRPLNQEPIKYSSNSNSFTLANYKDHFSFQGQFLNDNVLANRYISVLYDNNQLK